MFRILKYNFHKIINLYYRLKYKFIKPKVTERVVGTIANLPCEIEYLDSKGNIIGFWGYGYWDRSYPYYENE